MTNPAIAQATTGGEVITYTYHYRTRYGQRKTEYLKAPVIYFSYEGHPYRIIGGSDEQKGAGIETKVIFNKSDPQNASEFTFLGLLDFPIAKNAFIIWIFLSGGLYALATLDRHFGLFDIKIKKLTLKGAMIIAFALFLLPFIQHGRTAVMGKVKKGTITDEMLFGSDGHMHRTISYEIDGAEYKTPAIGRYDDESTLIGESVPVVYDEAHPESACIYDFNCIYFNNWLVATGMGLIFLSGWYVAVRMPNDEGNYEE